jgi:hypothetical protein
LNVPKGADEKDHVDPVAEPIEGGRPIDPLILLGHMGQQVLRDRPGELDRDRIPDLPIPLPPGSCQYESIGERLDCLALFYRQRA